jgi:hypothetical protein
MSLSQRYGNLIRCTGNQRWLADVVIKCEGTLQGTLSQNMTIIPLTVILPACDECIYRTTKGGKYVAGLILSGRRRVSICHDILVPISK